MTTGDWRAGTDVAPAGDAWDSGTKAPPRVDWDTPPEVDVWGGDADSAPRAGAWDGGNDDGPRAGGWIGDAGDAPRAGRPGRDDAPRAGAWDAGPDTGPEVDVWGTGTGARPGGDRWDAGRKKARPEVDTWRAGRDGGPDADRSRDDRGPDDDRGLRVLPDPAAFAARLAAETEPARTASLLLPVLAGAAVAVATGVYAKLHQPTGIAVNVAGFTGPMQVKVWLGSGAMALAVVQVLSALAMWGRLGGFRPSWAGVAHRWSGRVAFLLAVPVAVHCLYALGFAAYDLRTLAHSLFGCFFFGMFTTKMLALPKPGLAGWVLPVTGGAVFVALTAIWLTSSLWYFTTFGITR